MSIISVYNIEMVFNYKNIIKIFFDLFYDLKNNF